jgi:hypothetical protein
MRSSDEPAGDGPDSRIAQVPATCGRVAPDCRFQADPLAAPRLVVSTEVAMPAWTVSSALPDVARRAEPRQWRLTAASHQKRAHGCSAGVIALSIEQQRDDEPAGC